MKRILVFISLIILVFSACNRLEERVMSSFDNGQAQYVKIYDRQGQCIGEKEYYEDGTLKMEGEMVDGHREGEWKCYFPDGKPQSIGYFKDGLRTGKSTVYRETGQLYMEGYYNEGKSCGHWTYYDEQGYVIGEEDRGE